MPPVSRGDRALAVRSPSLYAVTIALALSVAGISGVLGAFGGAFVAMWAALRTERNRQAFEREQDARRERAQAMRAARILDSVLQQAEALLQFSIVNDKKLWVDGLEIPATAVWPEIRGEIAAILEPSAWIAVNVGFLAVDHMRMFEAHYRKDDTTDLTPNAQALFSPVIRDIRAAREALHPVAYPDHIRLPQGHPMQVLLAEQRASSAPAPISAPSTKLRRFWQRHAKSSRNDWSGLKKMTDG